MNIWKVAFDPVSGRVQGDPEAVTQGSMTHSNVTVSPDGEWLAYWTYRGQEDIYVIRTDGSDRRKLTDDPFRDRVPHWSPDGKNIAFYSNRSGNYQIWSIHPDASGLRQLSDTPGLGSVMPRWSHDGSRMSCYQPSDGSAYIFDPHTPWKEQTPVLLPRYKGKEHFTPFSWSPDGSTLAGWIRTEDGVAGSAVYALETREYRKLVDFGLMPIWLADGRRLLTWDSPIEKALYLVDSMSGEYSKILSMDHYNVASPVLSPDNRWIYFERISQPADIWMLTLNEERE